MITPFIRIAFGAVATVSLASPAPSVRAGGDDGVLIVQLAHWATAGKCAQAGLEFTSAELDPVQAFFRADPRLRGVDAAKRSDLWRLAVGLSEQNVAPEPCREARQKLKTWLPEGTLR